MNRTKEQLVKQIAHAEDEIAGVLSKYKVSLGICPERGLTISGKFTSDAGASAEYSEDVYLDL